MKKEGFKRVGRLPGLVQGVAGFGTRPRLRQLVRWVAALGLFCITRNRLHLFPNMTVIYRKNHPDKVKN
jgi:hypothetical protein